MIWDTEEHLLTIRPVLDRFRVPGCERLQEASIQLVFLPLVRGAVSVGAVLRAAVRPDLRFVNGAGAVLIQLSEVWFFD